MPYAGHFLLFEMGKSKEEEEEGNAYENQRSRVPDVSRTGVFFYFFTYRCALFELSLGV
jgi:hypothetical protein